MLESLYMYIYIYIYTYIYIYIYICCLICLSGALVGVGRSDEAVHPNQWTMIHTCHILPPSEIDLGLCLAVFAGSGGKYLFHRIG